MLRFTIRDVLWLTVVVGLTVGWWLDHRTTTAANRVLSRGRAHARDAATKFEGHLRLLTAENQALEQAVAKRDAEIVILQSSSSTAGP